MEEIWKDIDGYEGYYQVSNKGRVRSLDRVAWNHNGYAPKKGILLVSRANATGHHTVNLSKTANLKCSLFIDWWLMRSFQTRTTIQLLTTRTKTQVTIT